MSELTVKRMDAAIARIVKKIEDSCLDLGDHKDAWVALICAAQDGFIAGMKAGAKTNDPGRHPEIPNEVISDWAVTWNMGHDCHASAITAAIKRLKRGAK